MAAPTFLNLSDTLNMILFFYFFHHYSQPSPIFSKKGVKKPKPQNHHPITAKKEKDAQSIYQRNRPHI